MDNYTETHEQTQNKIKSIQAQLDDNNIPLALSEYIMDTVLEIYDNAYDMGYHCGVLDEEDAARDRY